MLLVLFQLSACKQAGFDQGDTAASFEILEKGGPEATESPCPLWTKAPAGEAWFGRLQCDSCQVAWSGTLLTSSDTFPVWGRTGWPCDCIDEDGYLKKSPECVPDE